VALVAAAQKAKMLGMDLKKVQSIGDGMLDIESSLSAEMEARVITGKNLKGIFVGAFNETKGWEEVRDLILKNENIFFEVVSKYSSDLHGLPADVGGNWKIHRNLGQEELSKLASGCDFFLLGSRFETQCLAAIECATLGLPILMKETGLLASLPLADRERVGVFTSDLEIGLKDLTAKIRSDFHKFEPSVILNKYGLGSQDLRREWIELLLFELECSFLPNVPRSNSPRAIIKKFIPKKLKTLIRRTTKFK
jgi:hypothetical protein